MALRAIFGILLFFFVGLISGAPMFSNSSTPKVNAFNGTVTKATSSWWLANIKRQGTVPYGGTSGYQVYRNVMDYGAKGDGVTDDTNAINNAISSGSRCGLGCDSSTTTPALVYFPPGTYVVSRPIVQYYYTQLVGDFVNPPTIRGSSGFSGIALIDSDPYTNTGANWYTNQNNFFRQIRNFKIDLTQIPMSQGAGIHWQVGQATSLQNIVFNMVQGGGSSNKQIGIFMDNGSGGFMSDLTFNGGNYGAFFGNQQFTTRNLIFNNCNTAIFMNWNWLWALKSITVNNCGVAVDMSNSPANQTVGSVTIQDSKISNTPVGVRTAWSGSSIPPGGGSLILDNVDFTSCQTAVQSYTGASILGGGSVVASWGQGRGYRGSSGSRIQQTLTAPYKPSSLLDSNGHFYERSRPQYPYIAASNFVSVKSKGARGDGVTDDTAAIQSAMNSLASGQILYFDHGAYVVSNTINVPKNIKITGEIWPMIMAKGSAFQNQNNPQPVFRVGQPGDVGNVEITDLIFETIGPQPGAILVQWNVKGTSQGLSGMWDVHMRVGGTAGTQLQSNTCAKNPSVTANANPSCVGAFMLFHGTSSSSVYLENVWGWVSDHDLDMAGHGQINIFNGRGILIEGTSATWLYGTAFEHSVFYNYQIGNAANVYMSAIQTETPYFQSNPDATQPFTAQSRWYDPTFATCANSPNPSQCKKSWGLKINNSQNVLVYGAGLYSFFDNYNQNCVNSNNCQTNMAHIQNSQGVHLFAYSSKAAVNMITQDGVSQALDADNRSNFCGTIATWSQS